jgi:hypothetical protein
MDAAATVRRRPPGARAPYRPEQHRAWDHGTRTHIAGRDPTAMATDVSAGARHANHRGSGDPCTSGRAASRAAGVPLTTVHLGLEGG